MSSKEKVLAIRPGAVCEIRVASQKHLIYVNEIKVDGAVIGRSFISRKLAWAAAYKYLTK